MDWDEQVEAINRRSRSGLFVLDHGFDDAEKRAAWLLLAGATWVPRQLCPSEHGFGDWPGVGELDTFSVDAKSTDDPEEVRITLYRSCNGRSMPPKVGDLRFDASRLKWLEKKRRFEHRV